MRHKMTTHGHKQPQGEIKQPQRGKTTMTRNQTTTKTKQPQRDQTTTTRNQTITKRQNNHKETNQPQSDTKQQPQYTLNNSKKQTRKRNQATTK